MTELANIIDVPVITTGTFQGHKGPAVVVDDAKFRQLLDGSNRFRPLLKQALLTGEMPGNPTFFQRLGKPMPAPITLNHQVLANDKIKESLKDVEVEFRAGVIDGKPWILERFSGVDELAADIIRRFFTKRSVEIMDINDPDTGETLPAIISTAFLDRATPPAVPGQTDDLLVEFAGLNESHYIIYSEGVNIMPEDNTKAQVDVSELQTMKDTLTELQKRVDAAEKARNEAVELAKTQEAAKDAKIAELQAKQSALEADKLMAHFQRPRTHGEQVFQASPALVTIVERVVRGTGTIELAQGETPQQGMAKLFDEVAELAAKNALLVPLGVQGEKAYTRQQEPPKSEEDQHKAIVSELMASDPSLSREEAGKRAFIQMINSQYGGNK